MSPLVNSELTLLFLLTCSAKATILLACAWLIVIVLRRRSPALRHQVWAAAILSSLALPFFALLLPGWHYASLGSAVARWGPAPADATNFSPHAAPATVINVIAVSPVFNKLASVALFVWALGSASISIRLVAGLARLAWVAAGATPLLHDDWTHDVLQLSQFFKIARPVRILQCNNPLAVPLTLLNGEPIEVDTTIDIVYSLQP